MCEIAVNYMHGAHVKFSFFSCVEVTYIWRSLAFHTTVLRSEIIEHSWNRGVSWRKASAVVTMETCQKFKTSSGRLLEWFNASGENTFYCPETSLKGEIHWFLSCISEINVTINLSWLECRHIWQFISCGETFDFLMQTWATVVTRTAMSKNILFTLYLNHF